MKLELKNLADDAAQKFYVFAPDKITSDTEIFVTVHGISLNAQEHASLFLPYAEKAQAVLIAPLFERERFPDYNCLGLAENPQCRESSGADSKANRADIQLIKILDHAASVTGVRVQKINLFGYSAGGQFAHRFALLYPERVKKLMLGAPGYFSMPDDEPFPAGLGGLENIAEQKIDLAMFLDIPVCLCVGAKDTVRDSSLFQDARIDALQGRTRVERALSWFAAVVKRSALHGRNTEYLFKTLPGCPHGFEPCMNTGHMGDIVFEFMHGKG